MPGQAFTLEVTVTDQGGTGLASTATVTVNLTDVNEAPAVTGFTTSIRGEQRLGTVVGSVGVSDPDAGDTFSYALTNGNTGGAFAIDASGQITVANPAALDFETVPGQAFTLEVTVTDQGGTGLPGTATVTVNLTDVNEAPAVTGFTTSIPENSALGTVVGSVGVSDPDAGDTFSYALTNGNTGGAFAIDASGQITVANPAALDFETVPGQAFTLEVTVTDQGGTGLASTATVTVNLTDVNEAPAVTGFTTSIAENSALGTVVGSVSVSDPDAGDTFSYALTNGNTSGAFAIDASGQITVANPAALDFETVPGQAFTLEVTVTDQGGTGLADTATVTVNLTDVNEAPAVTGFTTSIAENSALGTVVGSVGVSDPDAGDTFSYALTNGNTGGAFAIDASGQITVANPAALDFETTPSFTLTVQVQDQGGTGLTDTATVTVNLTNANEAPSVTGFTTSLAENVGSAPWWGGHRERSRRGRHAQPTRSRAATPAAPSRSMAAVRSRWPIPAALDFETAPSFTLTVEVQDQGGTGLTGTDTVTVNLTDVNEAPAVTGFTTSIAGEQRPGHRGRERLGLRPRRRRHVQLRAHEREHRRRLRHRRERPDHGGEPRGARLRDGARAELHARGHRHGPGRHGTREHGHRHGEPDRRERSAEPSPASRRRSPRTAPWARSSGASRSPTPTPATRSATRSRTGTPAAPSPSTRAARSRWRTPRRSTSRRCPGRASRSRSPSRTRAAPASPGTATVTVNLTDVNEAPARHRLHDRRSPRTAPWARWSAAVGVTDPDAGDTFSYALTNGNTGGAFAIDASGQITVANPAALDFETVPGQAFTLEVTVTDQGGTGLVGHGDRHGEPDRRERSAGGHGLHDVDRREQRPGHGGRQRLGLRPRRRRHLQLRAHERQHRRRLRDRRERPDHGREPRGAGLRDGARAGASRSR